jgi:homoserine kinase type II
LAQIADLLVWLAQQQLPVSPPLPTRSGTLQVRCDHLTVGLQRLLPGQALDPTDLGQAHTAGVILARLHHLLALYPRANALSTQTPLPALAARILTWAETYTAQIADPALLADCRALTQHLTTTALPPLTTQLVHNDYRAANLLWHEGTLRAVLDFEELRPGHRVNDLAWAAVHLGTRFHNWGPVAPTVHATFGAGYASILPLSAAEQQWLPLLMRWHGLTLAAAASVRP